MWTAASVSRVERALEEFVDPLRIGLPCGRLHHLAHEEPERPGGAGAVLGNRISVLSHHLVDECEYLRLVVDLCEALTFNDLVDCLVALKGLQPHVLSHRK